MIRINLLPVREERRRADFQQQGMLLGLLVVFALGAIGWLQYSIRSDIGTTQTQVAQTEASIKKFEPQLKQVEEYKSKILNVFQKDFNGYKGSPISTRPFGRAPNIKRWKTTEAKNSKQIVDINSWNNCLHFLIDLQPEAAKTAPPQWAY